jgi:hypothetical protein
MSNLKKYSLALLCALCSATAGAQYYDWGVSPASVKWRSIATRDVKLIYPDHYEQNARRIAWYLDTVRTHIAHGFTHGTMRTPLVIHTQNSVGNGMVMWAPKRIELLGAPSSTYSEPWLKQLAIHEYRHNVQYNNLLRRGMMRPLTWLLGEQIAFLGVAQFSIFILEGDATMAETEFSAFGRGLQPSWTMHYRAVGDVGNDGRATDYWFSGSFRDYVPDHYRLGYQMVRWSNHNLGTGVWNDIARYVARNPQFIVPMGFGLKRHYNTNEAGLFHSTFADLNAYWSSLPRVEDSSTRIVTPETSYTTYQWPLWVSDSMLVAMKTDLKRTSRLVWVDARDGAKGNGGMVRKREHFVSSTGSVSSRPALDNNNTLWWTEFRRSMLWAERVNSRLVSYDLTSGEKRTHRTSDQVFYPTPIGGDDHRGAMAWVAYNKTGLFTIVRGSSRLDLPAGIEVTGLAWDESTRALYFIGLDDNGMFLAKAGRDSFERLTPSRHITLSDLRAADGKLYFGSIASGKDEAHSFDLASGTEYRLSSSAYGSFSPSTPVEGKIAITTYDRNGYHLAMQSVSEAVVQPRRALPVDLVNPPWKRWNLPSMDSLVYTPAVAASAAKRTPKPRRFNRFTHIFNPHSWLPIDFYPPDAISENDLTMRAGATVMSQSLLSDAVSHLSWGWTRAGSSIVRGGISYSGLGPVLDVNFTHGGALQTQYTSIPAALGIRRKQHFDISTRLSLPVSVSSGSWLGSVSPSIEHYYANALIYRPSGDYNGQLTRGLERITLSLGYSGQTRLAHSEFLPRWGFTARVSHVFSPDNNNFKRLWSASVSGWLPGVVRPHSLRLRAALQQTVGSGRAQWSFRMKDVFPRGARYNFSAQKWSSASIDYQLPVWYPEGGISGVIYFKRVRVNLFADFARWRDFSSTRGTTLDLNGLGGGSSTVTRPSPWHDLSSWGGDLILDMSPLRLPATNHLIATFTLAKPSDSKGLFFDFSLSMPL